MISETIADRIGTFQCSDFNLTQTSDSSPNKMFPKISFTKLSSALRDIETKYVMECDDFDNAYSKLELRVIDCVENCTDHIAPKDKKTKNGSTMN